MCTESTLEFPPGKRLSKMPTKNVIKLRFALASPVEMPRSADDDVIAALDELHGKPWSVVEDVLKAILGTKCSKGRRRGILATPPLAKATPTWARAGLDWIGVCQCILNAAGVNAS